MGQGIQAMYEAVESSQNEECAFADLDEILQDLAAIDKESDFSSDAIKSQIKKLADKLKKIYGDIDAETGEVKVFTDLPWEDPRYSKEIQMELKKEALQIATDRDSLSMEDNEHQNEFAFNVQQYAFVCQLLYKVDHNLRLTYEALVPDLIEDEQFWKNYFYLIESRKREMDIANRLGGRKSDIMVQPSALEQTQEELLAEANSIKAEVSMMHKFQNIDDTAEEGDDEETQDKRQIEPLEVENP